MTKSQDIQLDKAGIPHLVERQGRHGPDCRRSANRVGRFTPWGLNRPNIGSRRPPVRPAFRDCAEHSLHMPTRSQFPRSRTAVLLVDVINPFDFPGGAAFARRALAPARVMAGLKARAHLAGVPVIYVNDNFGRWRSNAPELVEWCCQDHMRGAAVVNLLAPSRRDFVVLKSTLSGFYQTPLDAVLQLGGVTRLVIGGFSTDNCVLFTAADAYMRDYGVNIVRDAMAAPTASGHRQALRQMTTVFGDVVRRSSGIRLVR